MNQMKIFLYRYINYKQLSEIALDIEIINSYFETEYLNINKWAKLNISLINFS